MPDITSFLSHIPLGWLIAAWIFSAAVQAMPAPTIESYPFYRWFYIFTNSIAANLSQVGKTSSSNSPTASPRVTI